MINPNVALIYPAAPRNSPITMTNDPINNLQNKADETFVTADKMT